MSATPSPQFAAARLALAMFLGTAPIASPAQVPAAGPLQVAPGPGYADFADLVIGAPIIAEATIRSTTKIKPAEAPGLAPGLTRFYVEADVTTLLRGTDGIPPRIGYLLDLAPDANGRLPRLKKTQVLLFARSTTNPGQLQLVAPDAQLAWTPEAQAQVRGIATAALAQDAPPQITGIGSAFHVPGALPGEGETQIFLTTSTGAPVSLSILRRPGERARWAVALAEIVDEAAGPPQRDTLLWYRLACALPRALPTQSTASLEASDAMVAAQDYAFVLAQLGPCGRTRGQVPTTTS